MDNYKKSILIAELIAKSVNHGINEEEEKQLDALLESCADKERLFADIDDAGQIRRRIEEYASYDVDEAWSNVSAKIVKPVIAKKRGSGLFRAVGYAAAVLVFAVAGAYLYTRFSTPAEDVLAYSTDADSTNTMLVLPSGQVLALDNLTRDSKNELNSRGANAENDLQIDYTSQNKFQLFKPKVEHHTLRVPHGKKYRMTLADGTRVWLYAGSEMIYPNRFDGETREITLSGEAFFSVAKDAAKPFLVNTKDLQIRVVGTSFNVNAYDDNADIRTTVTDGIVDVAGHRLTANRQLIYDKSSGESSVRAVRGYEYLLRTMDIFVFTDETVENIFHEIRRWYDVVPVFETELVKHKRFGLKVSRNEDIDFLIHVLRQTGDVSLRREGKYLYISDNHFMED